jgi:hypothetical protein
MPNGHIDQPPDIDDMGLAGYLLLALMFLAAIGAVVVIGRADSQVRLATSSNNIAPVRPLLPATIFTDSAANASSSQTSTDASIMCECTCLPTESQSPAL